MIPALSVMSLAVSASDFEAAFSASQITAIWHEPVLWLLRREVVVSKQHALFTKCM